MSRQRYAFVAAVSLVLGMIVFSYSGFGVRWIRNYVGDLLAFVCLYAALSAVWRGSVTARCSLVFVFVLLTEVVQGFGTIRAFSLRHGAYGHFFVGTTFDWGDVFMYMLSAGLMFAVDKLLQKE